MPQRNLKGDYIEDSQFEDTTVDKLYQIRNDLPIQPVDPRTARPQPAQSEGISTQAYNGCRVAAIIDYSVQKQRTRLTPLNPPMSYQGRFECGIVGGAMRVSLWRNNVNTPSQFSLVKSEAPHFCLPGSLCQTPSYSYTVNYTETLTVVTEVSALSNQGDLREGIVQATQHFNDIGYGYPPILASNNMVVPFPSPPWDKCDDNPRLTPTCPSNRSAFSRSLEKEYNTNNWTILPKPNAAHHIKPLKFGGGNKVSNGVFLGRDTHQLFT